MVSQVVMPAMISIRTLEPRSVILKNLSSPPRCGGFTRTTFPVLVSVSGMPPPSGRQRAGPRRGEVGRSIWRRTDRRKAPDPRDLIERSHGQTGRFVAILVVRLERT